MAVREPAKLSALGTEAGCADGAENDEERLEQARGLADALERRVSPEVDDPPAARAQCEAERDQAQVVLLTRRAGEQGARPEPAAPPTRQREEPPAEQGRG